MRPPADILARRHARVRDLLGPLGLTRFLTTSLPDVSWLTGFDGSTAAAVVEPEAVTLVTDGRYRDAAEELSAEGLSVEIVRQTYDETLAALILRRSDPVGFDAGHLTVARQRWLAAALDAQDWPSAGLRPVTDLVEAGRVVKDDWEISVLRDAGARISEVAREILKGFRPGSRESEVAAHIESALRRFGFSRPAFDTIVASGPRSALPHGRASERTIGTDELVVIDFGGVYGGYCVDLTRTVAFGDPGADARSWYAAVAEAQAAAIRAAMPGQALHDVDRAAREQLEGRGLGERFPHGTGHGLGLEVHEAPRVGPFRPEGARPSLAGTIRLPEVLVPGMVFTVEPGAYVPGRGGVRIEDDVLVTASGPELLTDVPRTLVLE